MTRAAPRAKTAEDTLPRWVESGRPLVACRGGPYPNSWEFLDHWLRLREGFGSGPSWHRCGYVPVGQRIAHPSHPGVKGALLVWDAQLAVTLTDEAWFELLPAETKREMR